MFLTPFELSRLTGRSRPAAQRRALERRAVPFQLDADGRPLVLRQWVERELGTPAGIDYAPDWTALDDTA